VAKKVAQVSVQPMDINYKNKVHVVE